MLFLTLYITNNNEPLYYFSFLHIWMVLTLTSSLQSKKIKVEQFLTAEVNWYRIKNWYDCTNYRLFQQVFILWTAYHNKANLLFIGHDILNIFLLQMNNTVKLAHNIINNNAVMIVKIHTIVYSLLIPCLFHISMSYCFLGYRSYFA